MANKLIKLEKLLESKAFNKDSFDEEVLMKYMFNGEDKKKSKKYMSYRAAESDNESKEESDKEESHEVEIRESNNKTAARPNRLSRIEEGSDEISKLDRLSLLNMGARYELLNANKMMLDLDIGLVIMNL